MKPWKPCQIQNLVCRHWQCAAVCSRSLGFPATSGLSPQVEVTYQNALVSKSNQNHSNFKYAIKTEQLLLDPVKMVDSAVVSFCTWICVFKVIVPYRLT